MNAIEDSKINTEDLLIRVQETPNPYALKFIANQAFKNEGKATFLSKTEAESFPLVRDLFDIEGVRQVYLFQNTITVTHEGLLMDEDFSEQVMSVLRSRYSVHNPDFDLESEKASAKRAAHAAHENPILTEIEEILDRTVRPGLQADGGDIELLRLENNELYIFYHGACGGCPSSMMGTLDAIQSILRHELNMHELTVVPIDG